MQRQLLIPCLVLKMEEKKEVSIEIICYGLAIKLITPITLMLKSVIMLFFVTVMVATKEEMDAANLAYSERGFCAHFKIELNSCYEREKPFDYRCSHEKHAYLNCQYEE